MLLARAYLSNIRWLGWVAEPNIDTRGTWSILQSCIVSIFFCTATSLHLNIPKASYKDLRRRWTRLVWMSVNSLAPEVCMCIAMTQYLEAKIVLRKIDKYSERYDQRNPRWSLMQAFYFNMGGWRYIRTRYDRHGKWLSSEPKQFKIKHLKSLVRRGLLPKLTKETELIKEYSKQDRLAKSIALVQALWLLIQTFARVAQHLPTSPLEVTAVAYISCTFFSWLLWFSKPQDVGFANEVDDTAFEEVFDESCKRTRQHHHSDSEVNLLRGWKNQLPNLRRTYSTPELVVIGLTWCFTAALFGGLHILAWSYEFPTPAEQIMWRVSSIAIIVLPPAFYLWVFILPSSGSVDIVGMTLAAVYVVARSYNFIEVFFCFRSTPELLYQTVQWTNLLPHF